MINRKRFITYTGLTIATIITLTVLFNIFYPVVPTTTHVDPPVAQSVASSFPVGSELHAIVNTERTKAGLSPLIEDARLDTSAQAKCSNMLAENYWSHYSPEGVSPQDFITAQIPHWHFSGENISFGGETSQAVVTGWMGSPSHRDNILKPGYTLVGYAVCHAPSFIGGDKAIVVQHFVGL